MIGDLIEARLLLIRAEIHLEWMCKESRAARELVADIQKFFNRLASVEGFAGAGAEASSALDRFETFMTQPPLTGKSLQAETLRYDPAPEHKGEIATRESLESEDAATVNSGFRDVQNGLTARRDGQIQNGAVTDPGFLIARTPFAAREDRDKPPSPPVLCNPERPSIVKARKV